MRGFVRLTAVSEGSPVATLIAVDRIVRVKAHTGDRRPSDPFAWIYVQVVGGWVGVSETVDEVAMAIAAATAGVPVHEHP